MAFSQVVNWVLQNFPFWNASGGADHLIWWTGDQVRLMVPFPLVAFWFPVQRLQRPWSVHFCLPRGCWRAVRPLVTSTRSMFHTLINQ